MRGKMSPGNETLQTIFKDHYMLLAGRSTQASVLGAKEMKEAQIDCRTCKNYREQAWDDFCYYKGHKIVTLDRFSCKGYEPKQKHER